jgi:SAM-dependent methyltransferase
MKPGLLDHFDLWLLNAAKRHRKKYDDDAHAYYDSFFTESDIQKYRSDVRNAWRYGRMQKIFLDLFPDGRATIADVGCGLGMALLYFPPQASYIGIEFSEETLAVARRNHSDRANASFVQGGFPSLPVPSEHFDFVVCTEVAEHIEDDNQAIGELHRIIKPGGHMLFTVPSTYYWPAYRQLIGHFRHYDGPTLRKQIEHHGFSVVSQLPQHNDFWRRYHYQYILMRVLETVLRKTFFKSFDFFQTGIYERYREHVLSKLAITDLTEDLASTSIVAKRRVPPAEDDNT